MVDSSIPDRFQVLENLRHGAGVVVVRARDNLTRREVILQRPVDALSAVWRERDATATEAELRAARALARVSHPGVVRLLDVIETSAGPLVVMDPVPGETLAERVAREGRLDAADVRRIGLALCDALAAVHAQGVVHRGICAGNVILRPDGSPCLVGFVFAKFDPHSGEMPGTTFVYVRGDGPIRQSEIELPPHPAPEQMSGQAADARSDLFGLGWTLYEALTGTTPYPRDLAVETWGEPEDPCKLAQDVPKPLAKALLKCLQKSPLKRFASAMELRAALEAAAPKVSVSTTGATSNSRKLWLAASAIGLLALGGGAWFTRSSTAHADAERGGPLVRASEDGPDTGGLTESYEHSYALLIGIGKGYSNTGFPDLPNAEGDVDAIAEKLDAMKNWEHWEITKLEREEATRDGILDAFKNIENKAQKNDRILVYYAGHGAPSARSDKRAYLVPYGAVPEGQSKSLSSWVSFDEFFGLFDETKAKHVLIAMDCCYGGRLANKRALPALYTDKLLAKPARLVLSAGQSDEKVLDSRPGEQHSPFAQAFLDALSRDRDCLPSSVLFSEISTALHDVRGQMPRLGEHETDGGGQFVFFTKPRQ
jgi:serine/threonine protein kinase